MFKQELRKEEKKSTRGWGGHARLLTQPLNHGCHLRKESEKRFSEGDSSAASMCNRPRAALPGNSVSKRD